MPHDSRKPSRSRKPSASAARGHRKRGRSQNGSSYALRNDVFFIGFMGAGKSSVARRIARFSKIASLDMDKYISRSADRTIPEIFEEGGEALFRKVETDALRSIVEMDDPMFVSCGGGIIERPENIDILKSEGTVVHLLVDADEASERISNTESRPLFNDIESARELCNRRLPLYDGAADITIPTAGKSVGRIANEVMSALIDRGTLIPIDEDASTSMRPDADEDR